VEVSILVFLELALGSLRAMVARRIEHVSILVFLELALGFLYDLMEKLDPECFNPCFLGTCPRIRLPNGRGCNSEWFQSLFSWNLPSDFIVCARPLSVLLSFNPCFLGTCPRIVSALWQPHSLIRFQSLFSWNLPSDPLREINESLIY